MKLQVFCEQCPGQYISGSVIISIITYGRSVLLRPDPNIQHTRSDAINQTPDSTDYIKLQEGGGFNKALAVTYD